MTLHTKAATNDILDIFNQPLSNIGLISSQAESAGESDYEDDDYTSAGESTGTGRISGTSEFGDDETDTQGVATQEQTETGTGSQWSEFTISKHVPKLDLGDISKFGSKGGHGEEESAIRNDDRVQICRDSEESVDIVTPVLPQSGDGPPRTKFIPLPPEDYEPPNQPYRDPVQAFQSRLPFMTPIVEKTESSMGALTTLKGKDYFSSKSPSTDKGRFIESLGSTDDQLSAPFREIVNDAKPHSRKRNGQAPSTMPKSSSGPQIFKPSRPMIKDTQCNPIDDGIRNTILETLQPPLSSYPGFFDHRPQAYNKGPEIRKFVRAVSKSSKGGTDKTTASLSLPPILQMPSDRSESYTIKRELGKGAFAPVYLVQRGMDDEEQESTGSLSPYFALKCEQPPTPWEFYIMSTLHARLAELPTSQDRTSSLLAPHAFHLFADEGYLFEQYVDQGTLLDLVNLAKPNPSGVLDEVVAMFFTVELIRAVEAMHAVGILHGDLKADNCLVRLAPPSLAASSASSPAGADAWDPDYQPGGGGGWACKGLCLIDFGRGIDLRQFRPDVQFIADWKTGKDDCAEMREMRPWTWQVDYWGVAGVAHSLLFGKFIEDVAVDEPRTRPPCGSPSEPSANAPFPDQDAESEPSEPATTATASGTSTTTTRGTLAGRKKWKLREPLKRYWQTQLWAPLFDLLLNPVAHAATREPGGKLPVTTSLAACRKEMEEWLQREGGRRGLKASLRKLEEKISKERGRGGKV